MLKSTNRTFTIAAAAGLAVAGCTSFVERQSPNPDAETARAPAAFLQHDMATNGPPSPMETGWWTIYDDPVLDALMTELERANPDVGAALARMDQSFAVLGVTRGSLLPTVTAELSVRRVRDSVNNLLYPIEAPDYERYRLGASATWELDLWGRVRGSVKRDQFRAEAEEWNFQDVLLSLQANLARQYFALRSAEAELDILRQAIALRGENLELQESRLELGTGVEVDVARARVEFHNAKAAEEAALRRLGKLHHALALLVGAAPAEFDISLEPEKGAGRSGRLPLVPVGVPSTLLQRRPDLRVADRMLRAAAIQVGVEKSEFLPRITLTGSGGVASLKTSNLFGGGSGFYEVGPQIDVPVFQSGRRKSAVARAQAEWREAAASYRGAVLNAVREVDDALLDLKSLEREASARLEAVAAASQAAEAAQARHDAGLASYLEVIDAERERLDARLAQNTLRSEQWSAGVSLIQALGGAW